MHTVKKSLFLMMVFAVPSVIVRQNSSHTTFEMSYSVELQGPSISNIGQSVNSSVSQDISLEKSPAGALLRSFVLPGWGHYYIGKDNWNRGRVHLLADVILIGSYFGVTVSANRMEGNLQSFARQHAGVDLKGRGRDYLLNVAEFPSIQAYNDFQERSRNWNQLYEINSLNTWNWDTDANRLSFLKLDNRIQNNRQQLPAILSIMVVNRLISGISAYSRASQINNLNTGSNFTLSIPELTSGKGMQVNLTVSF